MSRQRSLVVVALLLGTIVAGPTEAQEIQRGKLKKLDVEKHLVVVTIEGKDHELVLTDETQVPGPQGKSLAEKLRDFREGSDIVFIAGERDGRQIVQGIRLAPPGREARPGTGKETRPEAGRETRPEAGRGGDGPQRGKVKTVDVEGRTLTLSVGEKDVAVTVTDQTDIRGAPGDTLAERLRGLEPGADVMFRAADRDGRKVLVGLVLAGTMNASGGSGQPVSPNHAALKPLDELGANKYHGYVGGLYPGGQNARPREHEAAGLMLAAQVVPLDPEGKPDPAGKIVLLSVGMSSTYRTSEGFQSLLAEYDRKNPQLVFVNGAQGGMTSEIIQNPGDGDRGSMYWAGVDERLKQAGVTRAQVQAIWIKQANIAKGEGFPKYARNLQATLARTVEIFPQRFPNAKLVYVSSRYYGGFATTSLNPEPYAYESGFAVKWLIEEQIKGSPAMNYDTSKVAAKSVWLSWGPYLWANGPSKRSADGLSWVRADFVEDGTHPSATGQGKVALLLLDFFKGDSTTRGWFNRQ